MSDPSHRPFVLQQLIGAAWGRDRIRSAVDAGTGFGGWQAFAGPWWPNCTWTAVEIHEPYRDRFLYDFRYPGGVHIADLRDLDPYPQADVWFLGDVLEHMSAADAVKVWEKAREAAWRVVLGIPIRDYPQGEWGGNPHEAHVATWYTETVLRDLPGIYAHQANQDTGAFIAAGALELGA